MTRFTRIDNKAGWAIVGVTVFACVLAFCSIYPFRTGYPRGRIPITDPGVGDAFMHTIAILFVSFIVLLINGIAFSLLRVFSSPTRFYTNPIIFLIGWSCFFGRLFIERPYFWGVITFQNGSPSSVWVEHVGYIGAGSTVEISGVEFGNSPKSISIIWWYGDRVPSEDKTQVFRTSIQCSPNMKRKRGLDLSIGSNGIWTAEPSLQ